jgi:predicted nuclease of predicted toxin-antitoxin system
VLRFLADENFNNDILRGLLRRDSSIDVVRLQDVGLSGSDDPTVLEMAAETGRVLLTHDASTMTRHAYDRVRASKGDARGLRGSSRHAARTGHR